MYDAAGAREVGLADAIVGEKQMAAQYAGRVFNLANYAHVPEWVPQVNDRMDALTMGLKGDATPDTIIYPNEPETVQTSPEGQEVTMDEQAIRQALGLDDTGDPVAAIESLKQRATDIATGEKGVENRLTRELQDALR